MSAGTSFLILRWSLLVGKCGAVREEFKGLISENEHSEKIMERRTD
jgi:hypothetical protein